MTPKERVMRRLRGEPVDRIPNLNIIMAFAARQTGVKYGDYVRDFRLLVDANIYCCDTYGIDMVSAISDPMREAHDFGADVIFPEDGVPYCKDHLIKDIADISGLKLCDPRRGERMSDRIKAVELYKEKAGDRYPILGWVEGAFAEAADLRGLDSLMMDMFDDPASVAALLEVCTQQAIWFAEEQIEAGADVIGIGDAAASLIGPLGYAEFALPYEKRIIEAVHKRGAKAKLHICGNITSILGMIADSGADMIDVDFPVDFEAAHRAFGNKCSVCGNFSPVEVLLQGSTETVREAVLKCVRAGNERTFIAAGCEVPVSTPPENVKAVHEALKEHIK